MGTATRTDTTPSDIARLARSEAVLLPADPPRTSRIAFWHTDGSPPLPDGDARLEELTVALPDGDGRTATRSVSAVVFEVEDAVPVLTRVRAAHRRTEPAQTDTPHSGPDEGGASPTALPSAVYWGEAALLALRLAAQGRLLPGVTPEGYDAWRIAPLEPGDAERTRKLAAAMPPCAHAVPLSGSGGPLLLPGQDEQLRAFLDAVADALPRTPAAALATGGPAFADARPQHVPEQREWADGVAAGRDAGVRLSLRIEIHGLPADGTPPGPAEEIAFASGEDRPDDQPEHRPQDRSGGVGVSDAPDGVRYWAVLRLHGSGDEGPAADAAEVWADASPAAEAFGPGARTAALLALRRAAAAWQPLSPLLSAPVPDRVELDETEISQLLSPEVADALRAAGVDVDWPAGLLRDATVRAVIGRQSDGSGGSGGTGGSQGTADGPARGGATGSPLADAALGFDWRLAIGDTELTAAELDRLADAGRPLVRLRDGWALVDPGAVRRARQRRDRPGGTGIAPAAALGAVLAGTTEEDGELVEVRASGPLEELRTTLTEMRSTGRTACTPPEALRATLRDYQLHGLDWLETMTSLGLGACLADDMGLGKTVTLLALHLHRQRQPSTSGPTLVVCPASLLGNWQREAERFAPGVRVRRYHGPARSLEDLADGELVLTTYGTMRLDAERLASPPGQGWGLVVADEAQHVKNPFSRTARALRTIPGGARVALTGTPVENDLTELWSILDWATPGLLGRLGTFRRRYADAAEGGDPAGAERLARLVRPFLLRRRKSDPGIAPELPPKTETDQAVSLTAEQAGLYEAVVRECLDELGGTVGMARRGLVVRLLTSLKQICNHPAQYLKEEDEPVLAGRSGKLEMLDVLLGTVLAEEDPGGVLVFTQYVRMARLLQRHLTGRGTPTLLLHGGTPVSRREEMVRRFQNGEAPVFLLSLKAAGTGLNLTRAAHVVHYDRWWNPAVEAQATDRAYRIGQDRPVQVHRLVTEGTVEDRIAAMLARKQALADAVLGSGEAALTELTDGEIAELVALRREYR